MEQPTNTTQPITEENWIDKELKESAANQPMGERLDGLKIEENKITEIQVDFSKPWSKWEDIETKTIKKIIPVIHEGKKKNFWLNTKNPLYKQLLELGKKGQTIFKIVRMGKTKDTRYNLVN